MNGSSLALTWRPTFLGGAATAHVLNVSGSVNASLPLSGGNSFTFNTVPGGTYTLSVSASNTGGTSAPSNAVTVMVPGPCSGASNSGGFSSLQSRQHDHHRVGSASSGPAPTQYVLNVTGAFVGSFPTTALTLSGTAGPGSCGLSVFASNACGSSPATAVQTITIP